MAHKLSKEMQEIARLAAAEGAKAALEWAEKERAKQAKQTVDRRLYNTKLLLRNYRTFKIHCEEAVYSFTEEHSEDALSILDAMMNKDYSTEHFVESIRKSVHRTQTIIEHIDVMIDMYRIFCEQSGRPEELRRWKVVHSLYIADTEKGAEELAGELMIDKRTVYKDRNRACERLSALLFGIDGMSRD